MASVIGAGLRNVASWTPPAEAASSEEPSQAERVAVKVPPRVQEFLSRIDSLLAQHDHGLSFSDLRQTLSVTKEDLRIALEEGLRVNALRRTGSHTSLRYLSNS